MPNLLKRSAAWSWVPDADAVGAPDGALLRATNTIPDAAGARVLRRGSRTLHTGIGTYVRSLLSPILQDQKYRFAGTRDSVYGGPANGDLSLLGANFTGSGDISMVDDAYQAFFARGSTKKKYDGTNWYTWGLAAPTSPPTVSAVNAVTVEVASFNGSATSDPDDPAWTIHEGVGAYTDGYYSSRAVITTASTPALSSLTAVTTTATATYGAAHGLVTGDWVTVAGVVEGDYNGTFQITVTGSTTYTYTMGGSPSSPATITSASITHLDAYNGALKLTPSASPGPGSIASASKVWSTDQDFLNVAGSEGADTDLFDTRVAMENPKKTERIRIMFGMGTGNDPFADDYYYFDFNIKDDGGEVDLKDPETSAVAAYNAATESLLKTLTAEEITGVRSPEEAGKIVKRLTSLRGDKSKSRADTVGASPAWGNFTVPRGQFKRVGKTSGRDWRTIRGFKIVYNVIAGDTTTTISFDDASWIGGGTRSLTGTFKVGYRFARRLLDVNGNEIYTELSPMSPVSDSINLAQQSLTVNIPEAALSAKDAQVDTVWVYLYGGWLDTYYRVAVISSSPSTGMTIDELANPDGSNFDDATERVRLTSWGFTFVQSHTPLTTASTPAITSITNGGSGTTVTVTLDGAHGWLTGDFVQIQGIPEAGYEGIFAITVTGGTTFTYTALSEPASAPATITNASITYMNALIGTPTEAGSNDINLTLFKSELDALIENEPFEPGAGRPPNNIISMAGPWRKRIFALTKEGWLYVSSAKHPSSFSVYHAIDLRQYGTPYWVIEAGEHIYVGCSKDIIRIAGSGDIDETGVLLDLYPQEMSAANPPADGSAATDGNAIIYRSGDGPMMLTGASLKPVPFAGTSFLWKGRERHEIQPLNVDTGRFRFEVDNHNLYMLAPEGQEEVNAVQYFDQDSYTVTAYYEEDHGYNTDDEVVFSGSERSDYNTAHYVTVIDSTTLSFDVDTERTTTTGEATTGYVSGHSQKISQPNSIWKYMPSHQQWCRFDYPNNPLAIWREYNGQLVTGTDAGEIVEIEHGTDDDGNPISIDILTPFDDGGNPLARKDAADYQIHGKSGGIVGTANFFTDGDFANVAYEGSFQMSSNTVYRAALTALPTFLRVQLQLSGSFQEFAITHLGISYRPRPQQCMVLDTGHIVPQGGNSLAWVSHVYLDCYSPVDLQLQIYKNGSLYDTCDIPVTANVRDEYTIVMPRGTKGHRLRFVVVTTNDDGEGDLGFEPYSLSVKDAVSGKVTELPFGMGDQGSN